jgi:organic hydroperoxide reductase OsmC/OhrA
MLTFLYLASKQGFIVDKYEDRAVGQMTKNERGVPWVSSIRLGPQITFGGEPRPTPDQVASLHHSAHDQCFIAASIRTEVTVGGLAHA